MSLFDQEQIQLFHTLFRYDPWLGVLWRKPTENKLTEEVVGSLTKGQYGKAWVRGECYLIHRIAFAMYHGYCHIEIDHENQLKHDFRILNLRPITRSQNSLNTSRNIDKQSGVIGIHWHEREHKFVVRPYVNKKSVYIGTSKCLETAKQLLKNFTGENK
jgi:hypothetical protein